MTQNIEKTNYIRFTYSDYKQSLFKLDRAYSNIRRIENSNSNLNIIKFKKLIDEDIILKNIFYDITKDARDMPEFLEYNKDSKRYKFNIPEDEPTHLKETYYFISKLISSNIPIRNIYLNVYSDYGTYKAPKKIVDEVFEPAYNYLKDELKLRMMPLEEELRMGQVNNINIREFNGTQQIAGRDIIYSDSNSELEQLNKLAEEILKQIKLDKYNISNEEQEDFSDDINEVVEQLSSNQCNAIKIRKAIKNLFGFANSALIASTLLGSNIHSFIQMVNSFSH